MNKKVLVLGIIALLAISGLIASNMGFKLNYRLDDISVSEFGNNVIALPYNAQTGITMASHLRADIGAANVTNISRFIRGTSTPGSEGYETYTGLRGSVDFPLAPGEGVFVKMSTGSDYIVVGSHDPSLVVNLVAQGATSEFGNNFFAMPYHATYTMASGLRADIGAANVTNISRFVKGTAGVPGSEGFETYTGLRGSVDFPLAPGETYFIKMNTTVPYTPSHY